MTDITHVTTYERRGHVFANSADQAPRGPAIACFCLCVFLALSGCSITERAEEVRAKATQSIDRVEKLDDDIDAVRTTRARRQICERMSVSQLYLQFGAELDEWAALCKHRFTPPAAEPNAEDE